MATVNIKKASDNEPKPTQTATKDWYVDADGNVSNEVGDNSFHIAAKGQAILPHIATKYGFKDGSPAKRQSDTAKAQAPTENKAAEKPVETKSDIKVADNRPNKAEVKK